MVYVVAGASNEALLAFIADMTSRINVARVIGISAWQPVVIFGSPDAYVPPQLLDFDRNQIDRELAAAPKRRAAGKKVAATRKRQVAAKKAALTRKTKATVNTALERRNASETPPAVAEIDNEIAIVLDNLRQLVEQAASSSGAANEELMSQRITAYSSPRSPSAPASAAAARD
jgi:hypothetical protein